MEMFDLLKAALRLRPNEIIVGRIHKQHEFVSAGAEDSGEEGYTPEQSAKDI